MARRQHPQRQCQDQSQAQGGGGQFQGRREAFGQNAAYWPAILEGFPQIEAGQTPEIVQILLADRPVQAEGGPQRLPIRRLGALAQHGLHGIARHQMDEQKDQGADAQDHQQRRAEAGKQ